MPERGSPTSPLLAGKRVLVAEDELLVALLIEDLLGDQGCVLVGPFSTVGAALDAAGDVAIDFALLDVNLRGEKIYPVAERLDARKIPFLLLSGYGRHGVPADRPDWDVCDKPFENAHLVAMMIARMAAAEA